MRTSQVLKVRTLLAPDLEMSPSTSGSVRFVAGGGGGGGTLPPQ